MNTLVAPIISAIAALVVTLVVSLGIDLTFEQKAAITLVIQRILEKVLARWINPADVADPVLAQVGRDQARSIRMSRTAQHNVRDR